jgi:NhaA family Na+:H+ antiporter
MDDIGAVILIALFYSKGIEVGALLSAVGALGAMFVLNALGVRKILPYFAIGMLLWALVFVSGLHPTIAGVAGAMAIPATARIDVGAFLDRAESLLQGFRDTPGSGGDGPLTEDQQSVVDELEKTTEAVGTPLHSLEHALHPWVAFAVVPVFGFMNAGVPLAAGASHPAVLSGTALGLFVGKPLGVLALVFIAVKLKVGQLPDGLAWKHVAGLGALAGIGFTMSLFIGELAFRREPAALDSAKLGVLAGSLGSAVLGAALLLLASRPARARRA